MNAHRHLLIAVLSLAPLAGAGLAAQTREATPGQQSGAQGTSQIAGRVMTPDAAPEPLRRVIVTLTGPTVPGGRTTITDAEGRFVFGALPAGRYELTGTRPAFLPSAYGATRAGGAGIPLHVGTGQARNDVVLTMWPGAVITGQVVNARGAPAAGLTIAALALPAPGAEPTLTLTRYAQTNDRGVYRIYGLPPGSYLVASVLEELRAERDVMAYTTAEVDQMLAALGSRNQVGAPARPAPAAAPDADTVAYVPMFYPGTAGSDTASVVSVGAGETREGLDFAVHPTRMATITGRLLDNGFESQPLIVNPAGYRLPSLLGAIPTFSSEPTPGGYAFTYSNVVPGRYTITAQSRDGSGWARTDVEVVEADVRGITLSLEPTLAVSGRIVFEDSSGRPALEPGDVTLRLETIRGPGRGVSNRTYYGNAVIQPATVRADGGFTFTGVLPDTYHLRARLPDGTDWWLESAIVGGVDVLDHLLEVGRADIEDAVLTFSDRRASISGTIETADGAAAPAWFIAVFPADRTLWRPASRRARLARAGTDGAWSVSGLPPGEYLVAAASDLGVDDLSDPGILSMLAAASLPVTLASGQSATRTLRIR